MTIQHNKDPHFRNGLWLKTGDLKVKIGKNKVKSFPSCAQNDHIIVVLDVNQE
jgi:ribulose bisphosphate carboxylase small subunit